jgi:alanine dehydrogenase
MTRVKVYPHDAVLAAVSPAAAIESVRDGFVKHFRGEWQMPPKVYVNSPPHGDFRAMPALGDGVASLKWVTSFPGNPAQGRPTVFGTILLSDATTGEPLAIVDGRAVTALRTGASAAVATQALGRAGATTAGLVGCGLHGRWAALCLAEVGFSDGVCFDLDPAVARSLADELGWRAGNLDEALGCDVVTTVTPGHEPVIGRGRLLPGQHVNALGADGAGKSEIDPEEVARLSLFCDEWEQASHGGELHLAVERALVAREDVTDLGAVLTGERPGRASEDDITLFDSTGLAIQDLAVSLAVLGAPGAEDAPTLDL